MPTLISDVVPNPKRQPIQTPNSRSSTKKILVIGITTLLVIGSIAGIFVKSKSNPPETHSTASSISAIQSDLLALKSSTPIQLYYPSPLPNGFSYKPGSVIINESAVNYAVYYGNQQIQISQQSKPPLTEELKKIKTFQAHGAEAYIANLEGRTAGFIKTSTTLMIFNPLGSFDSEQLQRLMQSMQPL